jgi:RNA polymerase sporulation-specific sigma factor
MHFRAQRKLQSEVSLSDTLEAAGEEGNLSLMDVIAVEDDMQEQLDAREACEKVRACVANCLPERERQVITLRYGLTGEKPQTQREVARRCGISRSYVSRIEKHALSILRQEMKGWGPE